MRAIIGVRDLLKRLSSGRPARIMAALVPALLMNPAFSQAAEKAAEKVAEKISVFPTAPYYQYIVYESLAVFWVAILGLLVIIRMKLREIERTQELGVDREDRDAPLLE